MEATPTVCAGQKRLAIDELRQDAACGPHIDCGRDSNNNKKTTKLKTTLAVEPHKVENANRLHKKQKEELTELALV